MSIRMRRFIAASVSAPSASSRTGSRPRNPNGLLSGNIKYNSGQSVQPIFEGWTKNADGSYQFHFGYLNRNHVEEVQVPIGAEQPDRARRA